MNTSQLFAIIAWLLLTLGLVKRFQRTAHIYLMSSGILFDLSLVVFLSVTRGAIRTALSFSLDTISQLHIASSTMALLLYFPVLWLGIRLSCYGATQRNRSLHIRLGLLAYFFRTLGLILMFFVDAKGPL